MSADLLRRAAALMRERATHKAVPETRWYVDDNGYDINVLAPDSDQPFFPSWDVARDLPTTGDNDDQSPIAEHIASWHPAIAVAVADWLDSVAAWTDEGLGVCAELDRTNYPDAWQDSTEHAVVVARAYLGEEATDAH